MTLTFDMAADVTGAEIVGRDRAPKMVHVVTDTRTLRAGDTFLALRGDRFDGHAFVGEALKKGAAALVLDNESARADGAPALIVRDTRRAYMALAAAARVQFTGRVVAITGSSGKTTTKHLLAQLIGTHFDQGLVAASPANENNEIGVSKLILSTTPEQQVLIVEMGARHAGEVADLVSVAAPHIGVLTNIGDAHLEIFGSREALAATKWGLFSQGAQAVLNAQDEISRSRAPELDVPPLWFGDGEPSMPGVWVRDAHTLVLNHSGVSQTLPIDVPFPGAHNRANLAAAIAAALLLGVNAEELAGNVAGLSLPAGRYEAIELEAGPRLIYDAYNANASGTIATLNAFASERGRRRIAVLSSMAELGPDAPAIHERVGSHAAGLNIDVLLVGGDYAASLAAGAANAGFPRERIISFGSNEEAAKWLRDQATAQDVVLLKGSRKYRMEEIVEAFRSGAA
ncbi:MAG TPA: UDP-N-acetylmuramoyl-tripeptide--D-alanyl-D-alanine ligase [Candidatus Rubrimentiphilum sp.]|nr:UDP-N-acetylmuramoyl-tripeptide--D-alanyl-D-alanine ligase [Candidatus Rubrimentiphilum sp.]